MTARKKRTIWIVSFCALFLLAAGVTYLSLSWDSLFNEESSFAYSPISFPDSTVGARAEVQYLTVDGIFYESIKMDFSDQESARELYQIESWANNYEFNPELSLMRWSLSVAYTLADGSTVGRSYQKCDWDEVIAEFVKLHEENVTEMREFGS